MRYGVGLPNFGEYAEVALLAELAAEAEAAGWDGFFLGDHLVVPGAPEAPTCDPWVALTAVAVATERLTLGPLITPLARRRPWVVAREAFSLDRLSGGRLVIGTGIGHPPEEFSLFGEENDAAERAARLDETIDLLELFATARPVTYEGSYYAVRDACLAPGPAPGRDHIPIWSATYWPPTRPDAMPRAVRADGVFLMVPDYRTDAPSYLSAADLAGARAAIAAERGNAHFDIVLGGLTEPGGSGRSPWPGSPDSTDISAEIAAANEAGVTWWIEALGPERGALAATRARIAAGP